MLAACILIYQDPARDAGRPQHQPTERIRMRMRGNNSELRDGRNKERRKGKSGGSGAWFPGSQPAQEGERGARWGHEPFATSSPTRLCVKVGHAGLQGGGFQRARSRGAGERVACPDLQTTPRRGGPGLPSRKIRCLEPKDPELNTAPPTPARFGRERSAFWEPAPRAKSWPNVMDTPPAANPQPKDEPAADTEGCGSSPVPLVPVTGKLFVGTRVYGGSFESPTPSSWL